MISGGSYLKLGVALPIVDHHPGRFDMSLTLTKQSSQKSPEVSSVGGNTVPTVLFGVRNSPRSSTEGSENRLVMSKPVVCSHGAEKSRVKAISRAEPPSSGYFAGPLAYNPPGTLSFPI